MKLSQLTLKNIRDIITGDSGITPYLTGEDLKDLFNMHGLNDCYCYEDGGLPEKMSRKKYTLNRLKLFNDTDALDEIILYILDERNFINNKFSRQDALDKINGILKFDDLKIVSIDNISSIVPVDFIEEKEDVDVHFKKIQSTIIEHIKEAKFTIWIAVAWFTDKKIFWELVKKKKEGVNIQIVIINDDTNNSSGINFESHFEIYRIPKTEPHDNIMHNKFCIIDLKTVLHGTYNWTYKASFNKETISIDKSKRIAEKFALEFLNLKKIKYSKKEQ